MTSLVPLRTGVSLEVKLSPPPPSADGPGHRLAVCLHPWSWLGGRMDDPVLQMLTKPLHARGYHVLRYNSRGVGRSTGWASFTGLSEVGDLEALVEWALERVGEVRGVVIVGYSYGSLIASQQSLLANIPTSHLLLSYPLGVRGWLTLFKARYQERLEALLRDAKANVLVVFGDCDEFTGAGRYRAWRSGLEGIGGGKVECVEVEGGTHFWRDKDGEEVVERMVGWLP
ncbi:Alpha/Beta hydrolase protein [Mycena alexandri]|uniref:Alpha/Beta hydrolase protein n=1 Tax=Mycena alexandri TaxID=1745969 RepID=A0AAD6SW65_9AGAR|nr:Alpha/Beta hydrolase protein [Mycena alexandri]